MSEQRRCQYHCAACSSCFTSLRAFDLHRFGPWEKRTCWDESVEERVEVVRDDGLCEFGFDVPTLGRTLWRENRSESCASRDFTASEGDLDPAA